MRKKLKNYIVDLLGGECVLCGYKRCRRALHFHHINPHEKETNISNLTNINQIKLELEKCILLCSNCHCEVHEGFVDLEVLLELAEKI